MVDAQYRRAVVLLKMGRFADADCCAKWSQLLVEGRPAAEDDGVEKQVDEHGNYTVTLEQAKADTSGQKAQKDAGPGSLADAASMATATSRDWNRAYTWRCQSLAQMEKLPHDAPGRKVGVTKVPPRPSLQTKKSDKAVGGTAATAQSPATAVVKPEPAPGSVPDDKLTLRADFYQTTQTVNISLFVKGADKVEIGFGETYVTLAGLPRAAAPYVQPGDRESYSTLYLFGEVVPSLCQSKVSPHKIELVLKKAVPGVKWNAWGKEVIGEPVAVEAFRQTAEDETPAAFVSSQAKVQNGEAIASNSATSIKASAELNPTPVKDATKPAVAGPPVYPTSSKSGPKNWDKLAEKEAADDEDEKDVNFFFKKLFKDGTPEQQRAMMKSFTESNGTALSTDWNDVSSRTVETVPPDGVEAKKWD
jgi:suppressor of G2 allele of SKP1